MRNMRTMSRYTWIAILALLLTVLTGRGYGQDGPIELRLKFSRGEVSFYTVNATGQFDSQTEQFSYREAVRVLEVEADGTALVEVAREDFRKPDGSPSDWNDSYEPETFKVRPDGRVTERLSGRRLFELLVVRGSVVAVVNELDVTSPSALRSLSFDAYRTEPAWKRQMSDFPFPLPAQALATGQTWTRQISATVHGVTFDATANGTLDRIERVGDGRIARLRIRIEGRGSGRPFVGLPSGVQLDRSATFRRVIEAAWSVERGRIVQGVEDEVRESESRLIIRGQSALAKATSREVRRRQAVSSENIVVPSLATGFLIAPGKGIGASTLDLTVEELAKRFDVPWTRNESLFRVPSVRWWPNELVGYVDPADQTKPLGLQIGDRRYRTEKGIGFGSSQGAALVGYGMSPASASVSMEKIGTVRIMIYDDQGIAFLVIGERALDATDQVPPVGTVLSTVVFVPGAAGRIFPAP